jgi:hypothetical protein
MITLIPGEYRTLLTLVEQQGKDAAPKIRAFFDAKEREYIAHRNRREAKGEIDSGKMIGDSYLNG